MTNNDNVKQKEAKASIGIGLWKMDIQQFELQSLRYFKKLQ